MKHRSFQLWALMPEALDELLAQMHGSPEPQEPSAAQVGPGRPAKMPAVEGAIAVIPIKGFLGPDYYGEGGYKDIRRLFDLALASEEIGGIVFDIDSPGGPVAGVFELARHIRDARGEKPIVAVANSLAASAAYVLAAQADQIAITSSGEAGSIGVICVHFDYSEMLAQMGLKATIIKAGRYKAEGNPLEPLGEDARAYEQSRVDEYYKLFVDDVAAGRGMTRKAVIEDLGEGRVLGARKALSVGMVDRVASFETVLREMIGTRSSRQRRRSAVSTARRRHDVALLRAGTGPV